MIKEKEKTDQELMDSIMHLLDFVKKHSLELTKRGYDVSVLVDGSGRRVLENTIICAIAKKIVILNNQVN